MTTANTLRPSLALMLRQLQTDMQALTQAGAGYYSCTPFARRYNKLLAQARKLYPADDGLMMTFEDAEENDPKDPADKNRALLAIRIESNQLVTLLESASPGDEA